MTTDELREKAWTFHGPKPPNDAKKVAEEVRHGELYEYYMDQNGNVYFETETEKVWREKITTWERQKKKH